MVLRTAKICLAILLLNMLTGCSSMIIGYLFTNTVQPYSTDFNNTPLGSKRCTISNERIQEPLTGYSMSAEWAKLTVEEAARKAGITQIHYAELKTLSFLRNVYRRRTIIVYGD